MRRVWLVSRAFAVGAACAIAVVPLLQTSPTVSAAAAPHEHIDCANGNALCTEVANSDEIFGHYVGHDEPSDLFYSNVPGSGNQMRYQLILPSDPSPASPLSPSKSYNFELHPAFWFGMAMCDTQSYPLQISTCPADSNSNILDPTVSTKHAGTAFTEMQFYPPGWVEWPAGGTTAGVGGTSCDPTLWCAALNIDSLSVNGVTNAQLNPTCAAQTGVEYINFAFITKSGVPHATPNPVGSTLATYTPDPQTDLFMHSGDHLVVTMHDTSSGLQVIINDLTSNVSGSMTASAANGFGQVQFAPKGTKCVDIPYNFHPMYSTSSENTRVIWAAHSYNVAFSDEIGHFDYCNGPKSIPATLHGANCPKGDSEGIGTTVEPRDGDDTNCFPASRSSLVAVPGCTGTNDPGFDGASYLPLWPDGNTALHPTPVRFTSSADRAVLHAELFPQRVRDRPARHRELEHRPLQQPQRSALHADTQHRRLHAQAGLMRRRGVLSLLQHHQDRRSMCVADRQPHPGEPQRLRPEPAVRDPPERQLPERRQHVGELLRELPPHLQHQPVSELAAASRAAG